jgi:hypothetical protein
MAWERMRPDRPWVPGDYSVVWSRLVIHPETGEQAIQRRMGDQMWYEPSGVIAEPDGWTDKDLGGVISEK